MCTVTFIASENHVTITSNRDEHISRKASLKPKTEVINGVKVLYPKDTTGGGTWFAVNEFRSVVVLLNGAFQNHKRIPPYRKSRGQIVLDIISKKNLINEIESIDLQNIEQFTLVVFQDSNLFEFRWDGKQKHWKRLNKFDQHLWSSWTLYDNGAQADRNQYFNEFIRKNDAPGREAILAFHKDNQGDFENGFIVDRKNGLKTLSITQVMIDAKSIELDHHDLDEKQVESSFITPISPLLLQQ